MHFLHHAEVSPSRVEHTFAHARSGAVVLLLVLAAPLALPVLFGGELAQNAGALPGWLWIFAGSVAGIVLLFWWLCLGASLQLVGASFRSTNWIVKTGRDGLYLHLRSWQNAHFPEDGPTVALLAWSEIRSAGRATEHFEGGEADEVTPRSRLWITLDLGGADTRELQRILHHETARPGPERSFLGLRSRSRFHHAPALVPRPGTLFVEWRGKRLLREIARHVELVPPRELDLGADASRPLEDRVAELLARGETMAAVTLVRRELRLSTADAKAFVEAAGRRAA